MRKSDIFATIKTANAMVDTMAGLAVESAEYDELNQTLGWTLDSLVGLRGVAIRMSKRTGHYWVEFN